MNRYSYEDLAAAALKPNATQEDINALGEWFRMYGMDDWTGEVFTIDKDHNLRPIYEEVADDQYEVIGYELC